MPCVTIIATSLIDQIAIPMPQSLKLTHSMSLHEVTRYLLTIKPKGKLTEILQDSYAVCGPLAFFYKSNTLGFNSKSCPAQKHTTCPSFFSNPTFPTLASLLLWSIQPLISYSLSLFLHPLNLLPATLKLSICLHPASPNLSYTTRVHPTPNYSLW